jgi:hypothetical protein
MGITAQRSKPKHPKMQMVANGRSRRLDLTGIRGISYSSPANTGALSVSLRERQIESREQ